MADVFRYITNIITTVIVVPYVSKISISVQCTSVTFCHSTVIEAYLQLVCLFCVFCVCGVFFLFVLSCQHQCK